MVDHFLEFPVIKVFEFEDTKILSTYLYTINVGPYKIYTHKSLDESLPPQRVYMRRTTHKLDPRMITHLVDKTIKFYEDELFGYKYPFEKLDHVVCPDVRYAAMESAGCITYSEVQLTNKSA